MIVTGNVGGTPGADRPVAQGDAKPARHGDIDYERSAGVGYARVRQPDQRIGAMIHAALGSARSVLNVGAGAGSYEPCDRHVLAIEPSSAMRAQRPAHAAPAIRGVAEDLPLDDASVDAAMATITIHQWADLERGLRELRRVSRGPVVILTFDPAKHREFWLGEYAPGLVLAESRRHPPIDRVCATLGGRARVEPVPIPIDCTDGFTEAFYARPERLLDAEVRRSQSSWNFITPEEHSASVARLGAALRSGEWDRAHGHLRSQATFDGSLRLIIAER